MVKPMYHKEEGSYHGWGLIFPDPQDIKSIEHENEQIALISIDSQDLKRHNTLWLPYKPISLPESRTAENKRKTLIRISSELMPGSD